MINLQPLPKLLTAPDARESHTQTSYHVHSAFSTVVTQSLDLAALAWGCFRLQQWHSLPIHAFGETSSPTLGKSQLPRKSQWTNQPARRGASADPPRGRTGRHLHARNCPRRTRRTRSQDHCIDLVSEHALARASLRLLVGVRTYIAPKLWKGIMGQCWP